MGVNITTAGSLDYQTMAAIIDSRETRAGVWNSLLIDDDKGNIVNNTSGTLHYDDHKRMLDDVTKARQYLPTAFAALSAAPGVVVPTSLQDTLIGHTNMNEFSAGTSMQPGNRTSNQSDYQYDWTPQPIYHADWHIPFRQGGFGYKTTDGNTESAIQVALERDKTLMLGNSDIVVSVNGVNAELYGLTNHPATASLPGGISDWANPANSNQVHKDAVALIAELYSNKRAAQVPNSVIMFVANDVWPQLEEDYSTDKGDRTNLERIKAITAVRDVLPSQWLPDGAVLCVEAMPMTLRIPTATDITVMPWTKTDPMSPLRFTTYACSTLQVRADRNNRTGIVYATKA